jgi:DNA-binding CsgD family transcriptional regulator/tetratricopeptide (TPR) repeat protein
VLLGRAQESAVIDQLLENARKGGSGVIVIKGEAGIGKTALLDYATQLVSGMRVLRVSGVESEAEIPFGALHLLLHGELALIDSLPEVQGAALRAALGEAPVRAEDRLLVGLAVLTLLSDLAEQTPLLVLLDDAQWFDQPSSSALSFAARRLSHDGIVMILAVRDGDGAHAADGLPELRLARLDDTDAARFLTERRPDLPADARRRVIEEAAGNPLALLELSGTLTGPQHGVPAADASPVGGQVQRGFQDQIAGLPGATQGLLLVAAADDAGDVVRILVAARAFQATPDDFEPAERAGLIAVNGSTVTFRHPLVRAAAYHGPPFSRRLAAHAALAAACESPEQVDRHAWHRSASVVEPDEDVAAELERAAARAEARGGHATAASAYERAAALSVKDSTRMRRLGHAAVAAYDAGLLPHAAELLQRLSASDHDPAMRAALVPIAAAVEFEYGTPGAAARMLIDAADELGPRDPAAATARLSTAMGMVLVACDRKLAEQVVSTLDALPAAGDSGTSERASLIRGMALLLRDEPETALRLLEGTSSSTWADALALGMPRPVLLAAHAAAAIGDDATMYALMSAQVADCRRRGLIGMLPEALLMLARAELFLGRHRHAIATATEGLRLVEDTGQARELGFHALVLASIAAMQGEEYRCHELAEDTIAAATDRELTAAVMWSRHALALLDLGLGRYDSAFEQLSQIHNLPAITFISRADQIEAAFRAGREDRMDLSFGRFRLWADHVNQPWAQGVVERCRALTCPPSEAERHYGRAVRLHALGGRPFQRARTALLYGEWLRRSRRPTDARTQLRAALETFERLEASPWAERTRNELRAAGEITVRRTSADPFRRLTPQELQVVRLAATGATNREIAGQLFLSPRTVGYHLYKAYPKLGVSSRRGLAGLDLRS